MICSIVQLQSGDDVSKNIQTIKEILLEIGNSSVRTNIVLFPENAFFLNIGKSSGNAPAIDLQDGNIWREFQDWSTQNECLVLFGSVPIKSIENRKLMNAMVAIYPGMNMGKVVYQKLHLFDVDVPGDRKYLESLNFTAGTKPEVLEWQGWKIGLSICYDLRFSYLFDYYAKNDCDAVVVPAAFTLKTGTKHWQTLLKARAIESQYYVLAAAQAGEHRNSAGEVRMTYGHSLVIDPDGEVLRQLDEKTVGWFSIEMKKELISKVRTEMPMRQHRKNIE
jgi:predicted amidohydrolase